MQNYANPPRLARNLALTQAQLLVGTVVPFGATLHVSGSDAAMLEGAITPSGRMLGALALVRYRETLD